MSSKRCVYCLSQIVTNWVTNNPERAQARYKPQRAIEQYRQRTYGITQQESDHMFFCQRGICAICDEPLTKPHVDHNHVTGKVRGLLCGPCNHGIGSLKDNTTILRNAITYLETSG